MLKIGIGGNLGSGKSTVAKILASFGGEIIDADEITHQLLKKDKIIKKIKKLFPEAVKNNQILKKRLANIVFNDEESYKKYYSLIMPIILKEIDKEIKKRNGKFLIVDAPLLFETGLYKKMDYNILVSAKKSLKIARMIKKGFKKEDILARLKFQMPEKEAKKKADFIIYNNKDKKLLKEKIIKIFRKIWK
ncbi:MAG: dephospho-CoA kinase [candidate division WOR-3 bacterium]|nr:dephospho-CoA kinase [candidate division WOR-3 bacterium]MCX7837676.1 dephospho-CoA kinase [candidate division WOR-3 bacterium]MDW8114692.1 dephospho-CoA kinase [candidate division WOR-3 bacterium]